MGKVYADNGAMRIFAAVVASWALAAHAQAADPAFRERVVQLALLYGESSGIDLQGVKVVAREVRKLDARCSEVEVTVSQDGKSATETVRACK